MAPFLVAAALAASPALVVLPPAGAPDDASIDAILAAHDVRRVATVSPARVLRDIQVLPVHEGLGGDCRGPVPVDEWRRRLAAARRRVLVLQVEAALGDLLGLELELECLASPVTPAEMAALDLARAEADLLLASAAAADDPARAAFYASEATIALDRAALVPEASVPSDIGADVADALAAARSRRSRGLPLRLAVVGRGTSELRVNGRVARGGVADAAPGDNLVQLVSQGRVVAAMRLHRSEGQGAVLAVGGRLGSDEIARAIEGLVRGAPEPEEEELLLALAAALGERVVFVGWEQRVPTAWLADGDMLLAMQAPEPADEDQAKTTAARPRETRPRPRREVAEQSPGAGARVGPWVASAGVGLGVGVLAGFADGSTPASGVEAQFFTRVLVAPTWALAGSVSAAVPPSSLDTLGAGVSTTVPVRLGARWVPKRGGFVPELGLDLGVRLPAAEGDEAVPLLAACGGGGGPGQASALRLEACVGASAVDTFAGVLLGLESRVDER